MEADTAVRAVLSLDAELGENRAKSVLRVGGTEFKGHLGYLGSSGGEPASHITLPASFLRAMPKLPLSSVKTSAPHSVPQPTAIT